MIVASVKGFGPGPYEDCKVYENVAQCAGGAASTTGFDDGPPLVTGAQIGDSGHRAASGARHRRGALPAQHDRPRAEGARGDAGRRAEPVPRQAARPAAPRPHAGDGGVPAVSERQVRRGACRAQATRRAAGSPAGSSSARAGRPTRTRTSTSSRRRRSGRTICKVIGRERMADRPALRDAEGAAPAPDGDLRRDRGVDEDQDQVRGDGDPQQVRHPVRADPVDEGDRRGAVAARDRHRRRGRPSRARQVPDRRQPDQDVRQPDRGEALAAARRAHRRSAEASWATRRTTSRRCAPRT